MRPERPRGRAPFGLARPVAFLLAASPGAAGAQALATGDSLAARGDTAGAIAAYEQVIRHDPQNGEARYRAALLYLARVVPGAAVSEDRRTAEAHLRYATRVAPDSAHYWLALGELFRTQSDVTARVQVRGMIERALEAARAHGSASLAAIAFRAAAIDWERYEQLSRRYLFVGDAVAVDQAGLLSDWQYVENFFRLQVKPDPGDPGATERESAEERLRLALSANPRHVAAAGLLVVLLGERDRWAEAYDLARGLVRAAPDSGRAHALVGLALARQNRWREAQAAFDRALRRMTPEQSRPYLNLGLILKAADQSRFGGMAPGERAQLDSLYWAVSQPLFLSDLNQPRTEFFTRLTYVLHRWSDPLRGVQGYETDRGVVYVRYGPPEIWAVLGRGRVSQLTPLPSGEAVGDAGGSLESERNTIVWAYPRSQLRFVFSLTPGYARAAFAGDFRAFYRQAQNTFPVRFDNVPAVWGLDTILVQFAQFRGEPADRTDLAVYSFMPIGRMARGAAPTDLQLTTAAIVRDGRMRDVERSRRDETIRGGDSLQVEHRSWRVTLAPAEYLLRVEAELPALERAARSSSVLNVRRYGTDSLMLSDLVVAARVTPRDSTPTRWTDFFVEPSAGRIGPNTPLALLWEVYNLVPDSAGVARYHVDLRITVKEIERRGFAARILGGIGDAVGLTARGDDQVSLAFDREIAAHAGGRQADYLAVDLQNAPEATYGIFLTVTDRRSGRTAAAQRQILVTKSALTR